MIVRVSSLLHIYSIAFTLIALVSCDNRDRYFESLNTPPTLQLQRNGSSTTDDSVKISLKSGRNSTNINALVADNNFKSFSVKFNTGDGKVKINGVETLSTDTKLDAYQINIAPSAVGVNEIEMRVVDSFDQLVSSRVRITAFINLPPTARLAVRQIRNYEYQLDATGSTDQDQNFGGKVALYQYSIEGSLIEVSEGKISYNFGKPGSYSLQLTVKDNDGATSEAISQTLVVR